MLCYTSDMDDFDEICSESMIAGVHRMIAYNNILRTIYLQYFSMTISKCEQLIYKLICDCGYTDDEFSFQKYLEFLKKKNIKFSKYLLLNAWWFFIINSMWYNPYANFWNSLWMLLLIVVILKIILFMV